MNEQAFVLPFTSMAVHVTVFVPTGNVVPEGGTQLLLAMAQLSTAVTVQVTLLREH